MKLLPSLLHSAALAATLVLSACGSDSKSGVDSSKYVDELTADDVAKLCDWYTSELGGARQVMCGAELTVTVNSTDECKSEDFGMGAPHCQVSVLEACVEALGGDPCKLFSAEACGTYLECAFGEG